MTHRKAPKTPKIRKKGLTAENRRLPTTANLKERKTDSANTRWRYRKTKVFLPKVALRTRFADPEDDTLAATGAKAKPMNP